MPVGRITFFHARKGYGFIETDEIDEDVFFHASEIDGPDPQEGQEIEFDVEQAPRGPRAVNIEMV